MILYITVNSIKGLAMLTVKTSKKNFIVVPENLLDKVGIEDGEIVDIRVNKGALIITKERDDFLALEGALKNVDIDRPIKELDKKWKAWKPRR